MAQDWTQLSRTTREHSTHLDNWAGITIKKFQINQISALDSPEGIEKPSNE